jgi:ABC-type Fe3+/spermidine/putrescine transport system ATPase subunit
VSITLDQLTKRYQGVPVLNDVSLEIGDGEFFVLLGPSGSGKSTLLRAIAGLCGLDHGRIALHGRDVTHVSAGRRGVGLVFQNYALFRHMTVAQNIEFALRVRRARAAERRQRRQELLRLVALEGMDDRLPAQLSGGQQQRVAVARALAHKPEVLLLDEPFGALDAKIREDLRRTIREVQRELRITTILVTHDQEEAFAMADRIGVMNLGRLLETGRPTDLYTRPATRFVATFLGAANLLLARQTPEGILCGDRQLTARGATPGASGREREVVAVVRPEEVEIARSREGLSCGYLAQATVTEVLFTGPIERVRVRLEDGPDTPLLAHPDRDGGTSLEATRAQFEQRALELASGDRVALGIRRVHLLPTPLSSFTTCATSEAAAAALARNPLLADLSNRMKARIRTRLEPLLGDHAADAVSTTPFLGTTVVGAGSRIAVEASWLLERGAEEILVLPENAAVPHRVLIHWAGDAARRSTLAVSASVLRQLAAEAVYIDVMAQESVAGARPLGIRALLDARSEARTAHGLELRTELRYGEADRELAQQLEQSQAQMLIIGLSDPQQLSARFGSLLVSPRWPVLIVHRYRESPARSRSAA